MYWGWSHYILTHDWPIILFAVASVITSVLFIRRNSKWES